MSLDATVVTSRAISHVSDMESRLNIYFPNNKYKDLVVHLHYKCQSHSAIRGTEREEPARVKTEHYWCGCCLGRAGHAFEIHCYCLQYNCFVMDMFYEMQQKVS